MSMESFKDFKMRLVPRRGKAKAPHSIGINEMYRALQEKGWYDFGINPTAPVFRAIIKHLHKAFAKELMEGGSITLPYRMGKLEIESSERGAYFENGQLRVNYPIDWDATLKLWYRDAEAKAKKVLVRNEEKLVYKVKYNKQVANYNNQVFYDMNFSRDIKKGIKENVENGVMNTLYYLPEFNQQQP